MNTHFIVIVTFILGLGSGWLGKTWLGSDQSALFATASTDSASSAGIQNSVSDSVITLESANSNGDLPATQNILDIAPRQQSQLYEDKPGGITIFDHFKNLLNDRLYFDAMTLYQDQGQLNSQTIARLRRALFDHLTTLSQTRNNTDFSELIESYLSIYYDDIDALLLLADFNKVNGSYFEVIDVYLLAKTYAYNDVDQQKVLSRFNDFVKEIDSFYTNQKNWVSLINLYSHINTAGLMTSPFQFQQALAHLRSGDEYFAIEQFTQLLNDTLVGESAATALNKLTAYTEAPGPIVSAPLDNSEAIPLQKLGNQYLVNLTINRRDDIKLLIDTGASMTTLSRAKFDSVNTSGEAVIQDRRVFRTASGVIMGTVYSVPELSLGPYRLTNTQIAVLDFDIDREIDGLLGMNILGQFRFQIDQENTRLLLSRE